MSDFDFLVLSLRADAEMQLGLYPRGDQPAEVQLPMARKMIDLLAMLQEKTKGNLSLEEQRNLDNTVTELRFRYLQAFEAEGKKAAEAGKTSEAPANG
ncbi:MAG: DUF1844 domain-containing protein [Acidobacteria bacterium]|nr:DUF1844 domain-containing protein [Acidobacteriota bacterium]